jgi:hypothetical protein
MGFIYDHSNLTMLSVEMKWEREVERVMKQKNLTPEDAITGNYGEKRLRTSNQCNTGKLISINRIISS